MSTLFVGIDSGGSTSKLKARTSDGSAEFSLISAGANPKRIGFPTAADRLAELAARAYAEADVEGGLIVRIGVAGVGRRGDQTHLSVAVGERLSTMVGMDRRVDVVVCTDAELALAAAFGDEAGVVVIAGTGSILICRTVDSDILLRGGWGFRLGDEGGGYQIGIEALTRLASDLESGWSCDLTRYVADTFGLSGRDELISFVYDQDRSAEVAPFVIQAAGLGDGDAAAILDRQVSSLAAMLVRLSNSESERLQTRYVLSGGLVREPHYRNTVRSHIKRLLPEWEPATPRLASAVDAALDMAEAVV
ncbi:MAG: hypothetical protein KDD65_18895 [Bacteroidetes bacterium]|nr:hypothetical protein [Bacteroidota bacterium]